MNFYFAPLEGVTGHIYRNAHSAFFDNIDKYFAPFIVANRSESFTTRELNDLLPEHNEGIVLVPQILTNNAEDFIHTSNKLERLGYSEINLNLGCPSGTVVSKNRGSGFLAKKEELDAFLEEIFYRSSAKISVKTRIGKEQPEEFYELIEIFNKYPMEELIIHPRVQKDYYKNKPDLKMFGEALGMSRNKVCYNGDIFTVRDYQEFAAAFPGVENIMLGRGLITNPALASCIKNGTKPDKELLKEFHDRIYEGYRKTLFGDRNVLFKMKEVWFYMICMFSDNARYAKKIRKAERLFDYEAAVSSLFREQEVLDGSGYEY
jgi:tRNA-dihydrouridine synthase